MLTKKNRDNLEKLAAYLDSGSTAMKFNMGTYCERPVTQKDIKLYGYEEGDSCLLDPKEHACGAVGCAVGHGPAAGIRVWGDTDWSDYCERVFGFDSLSEQWDWMFSSYWEDTDNTPHGAAARIRWFLANGLPNDIDEQMFGRAPLCYQQAAA